MHTYTEWLYEISLGCKPSFLFDWMSIEFSRVLHRQEKKKKTKAVSIKNIEKRSARKRGQIIFLDDHLLIYFSSFITFVSLYMAYIFLFYHSFVILVHGTIFDDNSFGKKIFAASYSHFCITLLNESLSRIVLFCFTNFFLSFLYFFLFILSSSMVLEVIKHRV